MTDVDRERWDTLTDLLDRSRRGGVAALATAEVKRLGSLYRQVAIDLSQARARQAEPELIQYLSHLAARAHGCVYQAPSPGIGGLGHFMVAGFPRMVRRHAGPLLLTTLAFVLIGGLTYAAVRADPDRAFALFDEGAITQEIKRNLEPLEGEYVGNFGFKATASPVMATLIIANNVRVALFMFALGALVCVPGVLLMAFNARMVGVLCGVAAIHGHLTDFVARIVAHGVLELSAFCVASAAGLMLGWAVVAPGERSRAAAFKHAAQESFGLLGGACLMLVVAGIIEGFVSPHAAAATRWATGVGSGVLMLAYFAFAGRPARNDAAGG